MAHHDAPLRLPLHGFPRGDHVHMVDRLPRTALVLVIGAALVITLAGIRSTGSIIGPVFLALVLTITVHPLRTWLALHRLPDWAASIITLLTIYLILALLALALVVSIGRLAVLVPSYSPKIEQYWVDLAAWLEGLGVGDEQIDAMIDAFDVGSLVGVATDLLSRLVGVMTDGFFIFILLLFMAFDTTGTTKVMSSVRASRPDLVDGVLSFVRGTRSYVAVSAGFGLMAAVIDYIALVIMGVPGAFVWGVLAFVTNFIPNIGFIVGVVPPALIALLEGGPGLMIAVIIVYGVINFVVQSVIQPRIVGDRVGLSATVTFLSLVFWAWAIGPLGALLAVPLSLLLRGLLIEADPEARWALPLISGKVPDPGPPDKAAAKS